MPGLNAAELEADAGKQQPAETEGMRRGCVGCVGFRDDPDPQILLRVPKNEPLVVV